MEKDNAEHMAYNDCCFCEIEGFYYADIKDQDRMAMPYSSTYAGIESKIKQSKIVKKGHKITSTCRGGFVLGCHGKICLNLKLSQFKMMLTWIAANKFLNNNTIYLAAVVTHY